MNPEERNNGQYTPPAEQPATPQYQNPPEAVVNQQPYATSPQVPIQPPVAKDSLPVVALILALVGIFIPLVPIAALIMGIISIARKRRQRILQSGLAIAAVVISACVILFQLFILSLFLRSANDLVNLYKSNQAVLNSEQANVSADEKSTIAKKGAEFISAVNASQIDAAYGLTSDNYQSRVSKRAFTAFINTLNAVYSFEGATPAWHSRREDAQGNAVYGSAFQVKLIDARKVAANSYIHLVLNKDSLKIEAMVVKDETGGEMTQYDLLLTSTEFSRLYPATVDATSYLGEK